MNIGHLNLFTSVDGVCQQAIHTTSWL